MTGNFPFGALQICQVIKEYEMTGHPVVKLTQLKHAENSFTSEKVQKAQFLLNVGRDFSDYKA